MKVRQFLLIIAAAALAGVSFSAPAQAAVIKTSDGMGADAELRESQLNTLSPLGGTPIVRGQNRGDNSELATRLKDSVGTGDDGNGGQVITTPFPGNDRSSVMYMKFDLSTLPASTDSFWDTRSVKLRLYARNNNNIRVWAPIPDGDDADVADYRPAVFMLEGLDPYGTYSTSRTDRLGNPYTASHYEYNWVEGAGQDGNGDPTGITYYDAPGLRPHCISPGVGMCNDANIPGSDDSAVQTLGIYDDFDNNVLMIDDNWHWPSDEEFADYSTSTDTVNLPAETPITNDSNGVKYLVLRALQAYEDNTISDPVVTFIAFLDNDGTVNQPDVGRPNFYTPQEFLNRNYLVIPKEYTDQNAAMNVDHALDPALLIIPEPASVSLIALGLMAVVGFARRRRS